VQIQANELVIDYRKSWGKWPDTWATDYSRIEETSTPLKYVQGDHTIIGETFTYPVHAAYTRAGIALPEPGEASRRFTREATPPAVLQQMIRDLRRYEDRCQILLWPHARQLHSVVAEQLPEIFPLRVLIFGDDAPQSSEHKTFPSARYFSALLHYMYIWHPQTGVLTAEMYRRHGLPNCKFVMLGPTEGLKQYLEGFDLPGKAEGIRAGQLPPVGLAFVGCYGQSNFARNEAMAALAVQRERFHRLGLTTRLHGAAYANSDGVLRPFRVDDGATVGALYTKTLFGPNWAVSSLFNRRLFDLWRCGVVQLLHDPHGELREFNILPGKHYIPFDGTISHCYETVQRWLQRPNGVADMILRAAALGQQLETRYSLDRILAETVVEGLR
jgi:hypothetical protein